MSDVKPRASGPLWALATNDVLAVQTAVASKRDYHSDYAPILSPCRLTPGHGRVVPLELVEAIQREVDDDMRPLMKWESAVRVAIRAAIEGAL